MKQAAYGLHYVHQKRIIHRDVKPENMMVDVSGGLKIMDLGLAKQNFEGDHSMTMTGSVLGSPHYMSPNRSTIPKQPILAAMFIHWAFHFSK